MRSKDSATNRCVPSRSIAWPCVHLSIGTALRCARRAACRAGYLAATALFVAWVPALAQDTPFALRGFQLGTTLEEFRKLRHPDEKAAAMELNCAGDPKAKQFVGPLTIDTSNSELRAGLTRCVQIEKSRGSSSYNQMQLFIGNRHGYPMFEFFRNNSNEPYRLSQIVVHIRSENYEDLERALTERYGPPEVSEQQPLQTGIGLAITAKRRGWANATSSITLQERAGRMDSGILVYSHTQLTKAASDRVNASKKVDDKL